MTDTLNLPTTDEVMALVAKYGRSEYKDGRQNTDETLEAKEALFSEVTAAVLAYATAAVLAERERCARIASEYRNWNPFPTVYEAIASAIRGEG